MGRIGSVCLLVSLKSNNRICFWCQFCICTGRESQKSALPILFHFVRVRVVLQPHVQRDSEESKAKLRIFNFETTLHCCYPSSVLCTVTPKKYLRTGYFQIKPILWYFVIFFQLEKQDFRRNYPSIVSRSQFQFCFLNLIHCKYTSQLQLKYC